MITTMPPEDASHDRGHKYPFTTSEIFNCEINSLLEKFFEAPEPPKKEDSDTPKGSDKQDDDFDREDEG